MISVAEPIIGSEEINAVNDVLRSGMLVQGPKVQELEVSFAQYCGTKYAAAVNSGTAAIHAALYAAGIGPGDEVITTSFSFIATINPILFVGAKPVLVDIDPDSFNLSTECVEKAITAKTKAIIPVHLYGQPCDIDALESIAKEHNIKIIEDACQAVGSVYDDKKSGNLGDTGCFSLYATKNIMCGEGGMVTSNNENEINAVKKFRQHGMSTPYEYTDIGYNYRMTDLSAAIASEQLKKVDKFVAARRKNAAIYDQGLSDIKGILTPKIGKNRTHTYHQYTIRITQDYRLARKELVSKLKAQGIGSAIYYPRPLHAYKHIAKLGYKAGDFPEAELAAQEVLSLPVHPALGPVQISRIIKVITTI